MFSLRYVSIVTPGPRLYTISNLIYTMFHVLCALAVVYYTSNIP